MKLWVTLEGRDAEVAFQAEGDTLWLEMEGRRLEADFRRLPDGEVYSLLIDGHSHEVRVAPGRGTLDVTVHGALLPVEVRHPLEKRLQSMDRRGATARQEVLQAPMPGLVVAVHVAAGDPVTAGQALVVVEAMKMQNELVAHHDGVVADVLARPGDSVSAGQPLMRLRPPS